MGDLPGAIYGSIYTLYTLCQGGQKWASGPLKLKLKMAMGCHMCAWNRAWVLCESSRGC